MEPLSLEILAQLHTLNSVTKTRWMIQRSGDTKSTIIHSDGSCELDNRHLFCYVQMIFDDLTDHAIHDIALLNNFGLPKQFWTAENLCEGDFDPTSVRKTLDIYESLIFRAKMPEHISQSLASRDRTPSVDIVINERPFINIQKGDKPGILTVCHVSDKVTCSFDSAILSLWVEAAFNLPEASVDIMEIKNNLGLPTLFSYDDVDIEAIKRYLTIMLSCESAIADLSPNS